MGRTVRLWTLAVLLGLGAAAPLSSLKPFDAAAAAASTRPDTTQGRQSSSPAVQLKRELGYLPRDYNTFRQVKARADAAAGVTPAAGVATTSGTNPAAGPGWSGVYSTANAPLDANGVVGPTRYLDIVNQSLGIYDRTGATETTGSLSALTGDANPLSDPVTFWDPATNRFYYNALDVTSFDMEWGFSKTDSPSGFNDFCTYSTDFGYLAAGNLPDYPKFGQTADFLLIGINSYPTAATNPVANGSDIDWISKPQGTAPITTCPAVSSFSTGKVQTVLNADGTKAWTPVPAIQTDPSGTGWIIANYDVGGTIQADIVGSLPASTILTLFKVTRNADGTPNIPLTGTTVTVPTYESPADAPEQGAPWLLDTLDGRLTHAVSGVDPMHGNKLAVWTTHSVFGGAGAEQRWYEVDTATSTLIQSGAATSGSDWAFNGAISPDRAVNGGSAQFGGTMYLGFNTSSATSYPLVQMVNKIGDQPQSPFVQVQASPGPDSDFTCEHLYLGARVPCRWGDYSGATPDPTPNVPSGATVGSVWLTSEYVTGTIYNGLGDCCTQRSWNWAATTPGASIGQVPETPWTPLLVLAGVTVLVGTSGPRRRRMMASRLRRAAQPR